MTLSNYSTIDDSPRHFPSVCHNSEDAYQELQYDERLTLRISSTPHPLRSKSVERRIEGIRFSHNLSILDVAPKRVKSRGHPRMIRDPRDMLHIHVQQLLRREYLFLFHHHSPYSRLFDISSKDCSVRICFRVTRSVRIRALRYSRAND